MAYIMNKIVLRNLILLAAFLGICVSSLAFVLISGERIFSRTDELVVHSYNVITKAERLSTLLETMLAAQRGFIMSGNKKFLDEYDNKKAELSEQIASISNLVKDNISQVSRIDELRYHVNVFSDRLEEKSRSLKAGQNISHNQPTPEDLVAINDARINIQRINDSILREEYNVLTDRISQMENKRHQYFTSLLTGGIIGAVLILVINFFLFQAQFRRSKAEKSLEDSEQRFALAIEGTNDGIFDWDIERNTVFYSKQFFSMLGYSERNSFTGTPDDEILLIHPDDIKQVLDYRARYLRREISEYSNTYRMRHSTGCWLWINSRGKAIYNAAGQPVRMVGAHTDITYMKEYQEKLKEEKIAAQQANLAKSDFLAHMSHEIRTPLTAISGIAEILEKSRDDFSDKQKKLIHTLGTSTSSLKDLISDILDFSKIESGELELDEKPYELCELFDQVIAIMSLKAHEKGLEFNFDYSDVKDVKFIGDSSRMRQILINLIGNALKFSDQGGVTVIAERDIINSVDALKINVIDTGIGIPADKFDLIFERFKQADSSVSRKYGGSGLGLPISKNLARMMGGDISLESEIGKGSIFTLIVPFKAADERLLPVDEKKYFSNQKINDQIKSSLTGENRILLVEDYEGNIVVISYILDDLNLTYDIAHTGLEAIQFWKNKHYDLILMDVQMPEMDGLTASSTIRKLEKEQNIKPTPIIGMTAHALVADKEKCIEAGMNAYLPKPIVEVELKSEILHFLKQKNPGYTGV